MGSCHRNPSTCKIMPHMVVGTWRPAPLSDHPPKGEPTLSRAKTRLYGPSEATGDLSAPGSPVASGRIRRTALP